jgi:hypothetical protein
MLLKSVHILQIYFVYEHFLSIYSEHISKLAVRLKRRPNKTKQTNNKHNNNAKIITFHSDKFRRLHCKTK